MKDADSYLDEFSLVEHASSTQTTNTITAKFTRSDYQLIKKFMAELTNVQRNLIRLRFWRGFSYEQIARALESSDDWVKSQMDYAFSLLRERCQACATFSRNQI